LPVDHLAGKDCVSTILVWGAFLLLVLLILAFDLGVFSRKESRSISARQALFRTAVYFTLSCSFTVFVYYAYENHWFGLGVLKDDPVAGSHAEGHVPSESWPWRYLPEPWAKTLFPDVPYLRISFPFESEMKTGAGHGLPANGQEAATMYFTGYLVEQSLSMDNIFVIALILGFFGVPAAYQHRVLFWGIMGALILRGLMIGIGAAVIHSFEFVIYIFGFFLVYTAWKMLVSDDDHLNPEDSRILKLVRRFMRIHPGFDGERFFTRIDGHRAATPLFLSLLIVEITDVIFAVDSIPAVFGITHDPFLVFTSNVFAILGLRSLYFALADLLDKFRYLKYSLVAILAFVGVKMLIHAQIAISPLVSLTVIGIMLGIGIGASWWIPEPHLAEEPAAAGDEQPT
jgi:tellurite resistance protein TerC